MPKDEDTLDGLKEQINLYKELLELTKKEHDLLKENQELNDVKEQQREVRDKIQDIDIEHDIDQTDKLRLIKQSDVDELKEFEPILKELYTLEKKNQSLTN